VVVASVDPIFGTPTGSVRFFVNSVDVGTATLNGSGVAEFIMPGTAFPTAGNYNLSAQYLGEDKFNSSTSALVSQVVRTFTSDVALLSSANPSRFGQQVTFTATVRSGPYLGARNQIPTGTVTFLVDGVAKTTVVMNSLGKAVYKSVFGVSAGRSIVARYNGNSSVAPGTNPEFIQVTNKSLSKVILTSNRNPSYIGQNIVVTAAVSSVLPGAGVPTGSVTFYRIEGSTKVEQGNYPLNAQGKASLSLGTLPIGSYTITAEYRGSDNHEVSVKDMVQQVRNATKLTAVLIDSAVPNSFFTLRIFARGADNSLVPGFEGPAQLQLLSGPPGGTLLGSRNTDFSGGVANFTGLRITRSGNYRLRVLSGGLVLDLTIDAFGRLVY